MGIYVSYNLMNKSAFKTVAFALLYMIISYSHGAFSDEDIKTNLYCLYSPIGSEKIKAQELVVAKVARGKWLNVKYNKEFEKYYINNASFRKFLQDCRVQVNGDGIVIGLQGERGKVLYDYFPIDAKQKLEDLQKDQKLLVGNKEEGIKIRKIINDNLATLAALGKKVNDSPLFPILGKVLGASYGAAKLAAPWVKSAAVVGFKLCGPVLGVMALKHLLDSAAPSIWDPFAFGVYYASYIPTLIALTSQSEAIYKEVSGASSLLGGGGAATDLRDKTCLQGIGELLKYAKSLGIGSEVPAAAVSESEKGTKARAKPSAAVPESGKGIGPGVFEPPFSGFEKGTRTKIE